MNYNRYIAPVFCILLISFLFTPLLHSEDTVIFSDDFNDNSMKWGINGKDLLIEDGSFVIKSPETDRWIWRKDAPENVTLKTTVTWKAGKQVKGYGLVFRLQNARAFSYFLISANGGYTVGTLAAGKVTQHISWTQSKAIKQNGTNDLALELNGSSVTGLINGKKEFSFSSDLIPLKGSFGMFCSKATHAAFDNLTAVVPAPKAFVSVDPSTVFQGKPVTVRFSTLPGFDESAWVGLIPAAVPRGSQAAAEGAKVFFRYLREAENKTFTFTLPPHAVPGTYEFRLFPSDNDAKSEAAVSSVLTVIPPGTPLDPETGKVLPPSIKLDITYALPQENVLIEYCTGINTYGKIGLFAADAPDSAEPAPFPMTKDMADRKGTLLFTLPTDLKPGEYQFRLFASGNKLQAKTPPFPVTDIYSIRSLIKETEFLFDSWKEEKNDDETAGDLAVSAGQYLNEAKKLYEKGKYLQADQSAQKASMLLNVVWDYIDLNTFPVTVSGTVVHDGNPASNVPVSILYIVDTKTEETAEVGKTVSDEKGAFSFTVPSHSWYLLEAETADSSARGVMFLDLYLPLDPPLVLKMEREN